VIDEMFADNPLENTDFTWCLYFIIIHAPHEASISGHINTAFLRT